MRFGGHALTIGDAVSGSQKQSARRPTSSVRPRWASIAGRRWASTRWPGKNRRARRGCARTRCADCRCRVGWREAAPDLVIAMLNDIIELTERSFLLNLSAEARGDRLGMALELGNRSVFALNLACNDAERAVRNVPSECPAKLPRHEPSRSTPRHGELPVHRARSYRDPRVDC